MKKILLAVSILVGISVLFGIWCLVSIFFIGGYRIEGIFNEVSLTDNSLTMSGSSNGSGDAFAGYSYEIKGDSIYIKLRYVLVSKFFRSSEYDIKIEDDFTDVDKVYLTNGKENRLVLDKGE